MARTDYTFRVQALGGKFLADDIGGARIVLRDAATGQLLADGVTQGDSGDLIGPAPTSPPSTATPAQIAAASKSLLTLADGSASWWLLPGNGTSKFVATLDLAGPTQVEAIAKGPLGGLQSAAEVRNTFWLTPGQAANPLPGYVIQLPGLLVQPLTPQIHTQVAPGASLTFSAKVAMMCGCPITEDSPAYWPAADFKVQAHIQATGVDGVTTVPLDITADASVFKAIGPYQVLEKGQGTRFFQVTFTAFQASTGNSGSATVNFYCVY